MRIGKVVGTVTLSHWHPSLQGAQYRLAAPCSLANLMGETDASAEELVVYDELGASPGTLIAMSEGREAAQPFHPQIKPVDAYNAAILDEIEIRPLLK
jgi:microcompartment protein CcmK/EutM